MTREHCQRSHGGLYFENYEEFAATVDYLLGHPAIARKMGQNGREYVLANYRWPVVMEKYAALIDRMAKATSPMPHSLGIGGRER